MLKNRPVLNHNKTKQNKTKREKCIIHEVRRRVNKLPASLVKNVDEYSAGVVPERASSIRCRTLSIRHVRRPLVLHTPPSRSRRSIAPNLFCQQKRSECHSLDQMVDYCAMYDAAFTKFNHLDPKLTPKKITHISPALIGFGCLISVLAAKWAGSSFYGSLQ